MKKIALLLALLMLLPLFALAETETTLPAFEDVEALYNAGKYDEAFPLFEQLAQQGDARAMHSLARCYYYGNLPGGTVDYQLSKEWCLKAAELGLDKAMRSLGVAYADGSYNGGVPDYAVAIEWYNKAVELGSDSAMYNLAILYLNGNTPDGTADYAAALALHLQAAELGHVNAMYSLGYNYANGKYTDGTPDYAAAIEWYSKAADLDHAVAMNNLANLYLNGNTPDGATDCAAALALHLQAAELGNSMAMYNLGYNYANGKYTDGTPDYAAAIEWYNKAVELGYDSAMNNLANLYLNGNTPDGATDCAAALALHLQAAELGNSKAMFNLGNNYASGKYTDGTPDYAAAIEWYLKADAAGNTDAAGKIINLYNEGVTAEDGTVLFAADHAALLAFLEGKYAAGTEDTYLLSWLGWELMRECENPDCTKDYARALEIFTKAADLGDSYSMLRIADLYRYDYLGQADINTAIHWYKKAYAAGQTSAARTVVELYEAGVTAEDGTVLFPAVHAAMLDFLEEVYAEGTQDTYLLSWLGWLLCGNSDQGVCEADYPRALTVYRQAADLGDSYAMAQIGRLYAHGHIGVADVIAAKAWYEKAIAAGSELAQQYLDELNAAE